jgi:hypothetical protein
LGSAEETDRQTDRHNEEQREGRKAPRQMKTND